MAALEAEGCDRVRRRVERPRVVLDGRHAAAGAYIRRRAFGPSVRRHTFEKTDMRDSPEDGRKGTIQCQLLDKCPSPDLCSYRHSPHAAEPVAADDGPAADDPAEPAAARKGRPRTASVLTGYPPPEGGR